MWQFYFRAELKAKETLLVVKNQRVSGVKTVQEIL